MKIKNNIGDLIIFSIAIANALINLDYGITASILSFFLAISALYIAGFDKIFNKRD